LGFYTVNGASSSNPLSDTAICFALSVPLILLVLIGVYFLGEIKITSYGLLLAITSGAVTSGIGYAMWYGILPTLSANQAASLQLLVPILTAIAGMILLSEQLTLNFIVATVLTLGGVFLVIHNSSKGSSKNASRNTD